MQKCYVKVKTINKLIVKQVPKNVALQTLRPLFAIYGGKSIMTSHKELWKLTVLAFEKWLKVTF